MKTEPITLPKQIVLITPIAQVDNSARTLPCERCRIGFARAYKKFGARVLRVCGACALMAERVH